jgi:PAS domain S-box-containing protein
MSSTRVLLVEDNPLTRKMLRVTLESDGYRVLEAADGRAALAAAEREQPALVLQDLILPDMNGFELVRQLRALLGPTLPILALSGFLNRVEDARSADAGFSQLLVKPIEPSRLLEIIRLYLPHPKQSAPTGAGRRVLCVDDDVVQLKLTRLHLEQLGFEVSTCSSAEEALSLARAQCPDAVLSDVLMPVLDGFQLCSAIRNDPALAGIPVVLASAWYETSGDAELAARVGASALVRKTPELRDVSLALLAALEAQASPPRGSETELKLEHEQVLTRQLQRQVALRKELARRCTLQAAQISLLSGVADALALNVDPDAALRDVLAATLDAAGISKGALFLHPDEGQLSLRHAIGFSAAEELGLASFFEQQSVLENAILRQSALAIPGPLFPEAQADLLLRCMGAASFQIVPLLSEGRGVGVMVLCAKHTDVTNEDSIAFARAMGNQLAQSLDLAKSFARLTASERRYRAVTETAHESISILAPDGVILEVNRSFEATLGLPRERIVGRRIRDFMPDARQSGNAAGDHPIGEPENGDAAPLSLQKADGTTVLMEFTSRPVDLGGEKLVVSIGRDVTERVKTQAQLMFSDRMASIGALAAGVAHEINNPLMATVANLEFATDHVQVLAEKYGSAELGPLLELLRDASGGAECVRTIVRDLKIFSRAEEDNRGLVDVERVLESSLRMARNEIRHRAELVREYTAVPQVEANESRLGQVFLNLIVNAAQALPDGFANAHRITVRTRLDGLGRVVVDVEDTGPGIPTELLPRLFTPFFTTKPRGVGTGLGLSICRRIVTSFGGEIDVDSVVGRGTLFSVALPPSESTRTALQSLPAPVAEPAPRRGRILVVDDDDMSAAVVSRALSGEHDVSTINDADQALARIAQGDNFDVIICDLMMPVKTGVEFFADLSREAPESAKRIIFLTGGAFTVKARKFLDQVPNARLEKPFDMHALRALVNHQLL